jgi:rod shape-determining protein MreB
VGPLVSWRRTLRIVGSPLHGIGPVRAVVEIDALHDALEPVVDEICACIGGFVAALPDAVAAEAREAGILLTGGGALLPGLLERLVGETALGVRRAPAPLRAVIDGAHAITAGAARIAPWH